MRSSPKRTTPLAGIVLTLALLVASCIDDVTPPEPDPCATSIVNYENLGAPMMLTWCVPCHSSHLDESQRQEATLNVNFDTYEGVLAQLDRIYARAIDAAFDGDSAMPPSGGPSAIDLELLAEWINCEAPL